MFARAVGRDRSSHPFIANQTRCTQVHPRSEAMVPERESCLFVHVRESPTVRQQSLRALKTLLKTRSSEIWERGVRMRVEKRICE